MLQSGLLNLYRENAASICKREQSKTRVIQEKVQNLISEERTVYLLFQVCNGPLQLCSSSLAILKLAIQLRRVCLLLLQSYSQGGVCLNPPPHKYCCQNCPCQSHPSDIEPWHLQCVLLANAHLAVILAVPACVCTAYIKSLPFTWAFCGWIDFQVVLCT